MWISIRDSPIPIQTMAHTTHFWGQMCFWLRYASHSGRQIFHNQQMDLLRVCILSFWPRRFALDNRMNHGLWHRVFLDLMKTLSQCIMWVFWSMPKDQMKETIYGKVFFFSIVIQITIALAFNKLFSQRRTIFLLACKFRASTITFSKKWFLFFILMAKFAVEKMLSQFKWNVFIQTFD